MSITDKLYQIINDYYNANHKIMDIIYLLPEEYCELEKHLFKTTITLKKKHQGDTIYFYSPYGGVYIKPKNFIDDLKPWE